MSDAVITLLCECTLSDVLRILVGPSHQVSHEFLRHPWLTIDNDFVFDGALAMLYMVSSGVFGARMGASCKYRLAL